MGGFLRFTMRNGKIIKQKKWCTTFEPMTSGTYKGPHLYFTSVEKFSQMSFIMTIFKAKGLLHLYFDFLDPPLSWKRALMLKVYIFKLLMNSTNWPNVTLIEALLDICKSYSLSDKCSRDQIWLNLYWKSKNGFIICSTEIKMKG